MGTTLTRNPQSRYFCICPAGFVVRGLCPVDLMSVEDHSLTVAGPTVSTVGNDPLFRRLRDILTTAPGPKGSFCSKQAGWKWAEQRAEYSDGANFARIESTASLNFHLQRSDAWICQGYSWCSCSWRYLVHRLRSTFHHAWFHLDPYLRDVKNCQLQTQWRFVTPWFLCNNCTHFSLVKQKSSKTVWTIHFCPLKG